MPTKIVRPRDSEVQESYRGNQRGALSDRVTQRWVRHTGRSVDLSRDTWLDGPVGDIDEIGTQFFTRYADRAGLYVRSSGEARGLLPDFSMAGSTCNPNGVNQAVREFYERTSEYEFDVWSEWSGLFRPFGRALAAIFSRRLQQLNVPLSAMDTRMGISSQVLHLLEPTGVLRFSAWIREVVATSHTLYAGAYSVCRVPGYQGVCVKVVFPLPNGHATVIMQQVSRADGSLELHSDGQRYGDPGFYFYVQSRPGLGWARYVASLKESIRVYAGDGKETRADHEFRLWRARFLRLHYRLRPRTA